MKPQQELNGQSSAKKTDKQALIYNEKVNNVLTIYGTEEECFVLLGDYRLTDKMPYKDAINDAKRMDLERLIQIMSIVVDVCNKNNLKIEKNVGKN